MRAHPTSPHPPRARRRLAGAALTLAVTGLTTTTVHAADAGTIGAAPSPARPGSTVILSTDACGTAVSAGVDASSLGGGILGLEPQDAESGTAQGTLRIPAGTEPGTYAVSGSCTDGQKLTGRVVVADGKRAAKDGTRERKDAAPKKAAAEHAPAEDALPEDSLPEGASPEDRSAAKDGTHDARAPGEQHAQVVQGDTHAQAAPSAHDRGEGGHDPAGHPADDGHRADDGHHAGPHHAAGAPHGAMPHGRVRTGLGGGTGEVSTAQLAGGSTALAAAAGSVLYLRRRHHISAQRGR